MICNLVCIGLHIQYNTPHQSYVCLVHHKNVLQADFYHQTKLCGQAATRTIVIK